MGKKVKTRKHIHNWNGYPTIAGKVDYPKSLVDLNNVMASTQSMIPRGNGRSYGDASLYSHMINLKNTPQSYSIDHSREILEISSAYTLGDILKLITPHNYFLPVVPGTSHVTVGGAIASDVHGKNHYKSGSFSAHLENFSLIDGAGNQKICLVSRESNMKLFWQTCGGMGLTGLIMKATLKLVKIPGPFMSASTSTGIGLDDILSRMKELSTNDYMVTWLDLSGNKVKGIINTGNHCTYQNNKNRSFNRISIPKSAVLLLNPVSGKIFNQLYFYLKSRKQIDSYQHYRDFFYPLDKITNWPRFYGKNGFIQYQFVLSKEMALEAISEVIKIVKKNKIHPYLCVLKMMKKNNDHARNSFGMDGFSLAMDFKKSVSVLQMLDELDNVIISYGGKIYLAKDSRMSSDTFKSMYPHFDLYSEKWQSLLSQRLGLQLPI